MDYPPHVKVILSGAEQNQFPENHIAQHGTIIEMVGNDIASFDFLGIRIGG